MAHAIEAVRESLLETGRPPLNEVEATFFAFVKRQENFFWTPETINTEADNLILAALSMDRVHHGLFDALFAMLSILPQLDSIVQDTLQLSLTDLGTFRYSKYYRQMRMFQEVMEFIHERSYIENLQSAARVVFTTIQDAEKITNPELYEINQARHGATIDIYRAVLNYVVENNIGGVVTGIASMRLAMGSSLDAYKKPNGDCPLSALQAEAHALINFLKLEVMVIRRLIYTIFRVNMQPYTRANFVATLDALFSVLSKTTSSNGVIEDKDFIETLMQKNRAGVVDDTANAPDNPTSSLSLAGIYITNKEILRDENMHGAMSRVALGVVVKRMAEYQTGPEIMGTLRGMIYDDLYRAAITFLWGIIETLNGDVTIIRENEVKEDCNFVMDHTVMQYAASVLGIPNYPGAGPSRLHMTDAMAYGSVCTITNHHEIKSASYTKTLPGVFTRRIV